MRNIGNTAAQRINILYQSSGTYAPVMGISLTSLFENNKHVKELNVYIVDGGIGEADKNRIRELSVKYQRTIIFIAGDRIDKTLSDRGVAKWRNSYAMYYKLYALDLIETPIERLLAIDADTIIDKPIDPLFFADLDGKTLGMVQDFMPFNYMEKIGMNKKETYYNSGVVLFDVDKWKRRKCQDKLEIFLKGNLNNILYADQDAISIVLQSEIKKFPIIYNYFTIFSSICECLSFNLETVYKLYDISKLNCFYTVDEMRKAETDAIIYHYEGGTVVGRPWEHGEQYGIFAIWDKYKMISPWKDMNMSNSQTKEYHIIERKLSKILPKPLFLAIYKMAYDAYWKRILQIRPNN